MKGDMDGAGADYAKAIQVDPKCAAAYESRGLWNYDKRAWADALADFKKFCEISTAGQDAVRLRIWLVRARLGERDAATKDLKAFIEKREAAQDWDLQIARFLAGELGEGDLLKAAGDKGARLCEARFYAGAKRAIDGDKAGAAELLKKCEAGPKDSPCRTSAAAELEALK